MTRSSVTVPSVLAPWLDQILQGDHLAQEVLISPGKWRAKFSSGAEVDADVDAMCSRFQDATGNLGRVTRHGVAMLGSEAREGGAIERRRLMIGTFLFGYGRLGRGYGNAVRALQSQRVDEVLAAVGSALDEHDIVRAYRSFSEPHLPGFDVGFFTKYLYFYSRLDVDWEVGAAKPAIFDSFVKTTLQFIKSPLGVNWAEGVEVTGAANHYRQYCDALRNWTDQLSVSDRPVSFDQIEYFFYLAATARVRRGETPFIFSSADILSTVASALVSPTEGPKSKRLEAAVAALPPHMVALRQ